MTPLPQVAVLDIDICGPSIPKVMGVEGEQVHQSGSGWSPVVSEYTTAVSVASLHGSPHKHYRVCHQFQEISHTHIITHCVFPATQ